MLGEVVPLAEVGARGLAGDRLWAVRDPDGKLGSGKNASTSSVVRGVALEIRPDLVERGGGDQVGGVLVAQGFQPPYPAGVGFGVHRLYALAFSARS